jgi:threonine/homoserine/homoserine lactone efflux protein
MEHYFLFMIVAAATVLTPGPGVMLTLTNSLRYRLSDTLGGILGIALGALIVAAVSATGVGLILATSALAFTIMKYVGAVYLIYLGLKMWRSPSSIVSEAPVEQSNMRMRFLEGLSVQLSNPKAIFFFMAVFPQFIDRGGQYAVQFFALVLTYSSLVVVIHFLYALIASRAKSWLFSPSRTRVVNRLGGSAFMFFGVALATTNK